MAAAIEIEEQDERKLMWALRLSLRLSLWLIAAGAAGVVAIVAAGWLGLLGPNPGEEIGFPIVFFGLSFAIAACGIVLLNLSLVLIAIFEKLGTNRDADG